MALPPGVFVSVCSMNMLMSPAVVPAAYQFPMHVPILDGHMVEWFGHIWGGFVLKRLMDVSGDLMTVGEPPSSVSRKERGLETRGKNTSRTSLTTNYSRCWSRPRSTSGRTRTATTWLGSRGIPPSRRGSIPHSTKLLEELFPASRPGLKHSRGMRRPRNPLAPSCLLPPAWSQNHEIQRRRLATRRRESYRRGSALQGTTGVSRNRPHAARRVRAASS